MNILIEFSLFFLFIALLVSIFPMLTYSREKVIFRSKQYYFRKIFRFQMIILYTFLFLYVFRINIYPYYHSETLYLILYLISSFMYVISSFLKILPRIESLFYAVSLLITSGYVAFGYFLRDL